jgi:tetratricopeptide (TPR) repeat protein
MKGYTTRDVHKLLGLSPARVRELARSGVLDAVRGPGNRYVFGFRDLVLLRSARALLDSNVPPRRVLAALRRLRRELPADRSITEVHIVAEGDRVVIHDQGQEWDASSGQLRLGFHVADLARQVEPLARRAVDSGLAAAASADGGPEGGGSADGGSAAGGSAAGGSAAGENSADYWFELGLELEVHSPAEARRAYERAVELEPRHADALVNLGRLLYEQGATDGAIVHYRRALEAADGHHAIAAFNLGLALEDLGRNRAAADAYKAALLADPSFADAQYNLARVHERLGDRVSALRWLKSYRALTRQTGHS